MQQNQFLRGLAFLCGTKLSGGVFRRLRVFEQEKQWLAGVELREYILCGF